MKLKKKPKHYPVDLKKSCIPSSEDFPVKTSLNFCTRIWFALITFVWTRSNSHSINFEVFPTFQSVTHCQMKFCEAAQGLPQSDSWSSYKPSVPTYIHRGLCTVVPWKSLSHVRLFATPWNSPGHNTGVGSPFLLQGIFPTQGSNPGLPHCRRILYQLSHKGRPRILEWVAYSFSSGSSQPRNWRGVSCIAGRFFINWATRKPGSCLFSSVQFYPWTQLFSDNLPPKSSYKTQTVISITYLHSLSCFSKSFMLIMSSEPLKNSLTQVVKSVKSSMLFHSPWLCPYNQYHSLWQIIICSVVICVFFFIVFSLQHLQTLGFITCIRAPYHRITIK